MSENPPTFTPAASWATWMMALAFSIAALGIFTRHNSFSYLYHTDEPSKVEQVITRNYNFHHPLLLVRTAEALAHLTGTPAEPQPVVQKGRLASAIFAALSVGFVVVAAAGLAGPPAGGIAGLLAITHPVLFELSHYFKEDCALVVGVTATTAGLVYYGRVPSFWRAALVGAAAGVTVSGKYLGIAMAVVALAGLAWQPARSGRILTVLVAVVAMCGTFALINAPSFEHVEKVESSLKEELSKVEKRAEERPEAIRFKHLSKIGTTLSVPLLVGVGFWFWFCRKQSEFVPKAWWAVGIFLVGFFILVSLAPKTKDRYVLPVYVTACTLGAAGLGAWWRSCQASKVSLHRTLGVIWILAAVLWHLPSLFGNFQAFRQDDRVDLAAWVRANVPMDVALATDVRVLLGRAKTSEVTDLHVPNRIDVPPDRYVADLGAIDALRRSGVGFVVVCQPDYNNTTKGGGKMKERRRWYEELFRSSTLVWERPVGRLAYLQPGLRVYSLEKDRVQSREQ